MATVDKMRRIWNPICSQSLLNICNQLRQCMPNVIEAQEARLKAIVHRSLKTDYY